MPKFTRVGLILRIMANRGSYPSSKDGRVFRTKSNDYVDASLMATCPFNKAHVMKTHRLQYHIVQCIKNYTGTKVPCPYNHSEYFKPEDLLSHLPSCASRAALETHRFISDRNMEVAMEKSNGYAFAAPVLPGQRYTDEDWDED